jgi:hypothetical protein
MRYMTANGTQYDLKGASLANAGSANDLGESLKDYEEAWNYAGHNGLAGSILISATWQGDKSHPLASCIMFEKGMSASDCLIHLYGHQVARVRKRTPGIGRRAVLFVWSHEYGAYYVLRFKYEPASLYVNDRNEVLA